MKILLISHIAMRKIYESALHVCGISQLKTSRYWLNECNFFTKNMLTLVVAALLTYLTIDDVYNVPIMYTCTAACGVCMTS